MRSPRPARLSAAPLLLLLLATTACAARASSSWSAAGADPTLKFEAPVPGKLEQQGMGERTWCTDRRHVLRRNRRRRRRRRTTHVHTHTNKTTQTELYGDAQRHASSESLLSRLLGFDCYTQAVARLERDCGALDEDARVRLAVDFARCEWVGGGGRRRRCATEQTRWATLCLPRTHSHKKTKHNNKNTAAS